MTLPLKLFLQTQRDNKVGFTKGASSELLPFPLFNLSQQSGALDLLEHVFKAGESVPINFLK